MAAEQSQELRLLAIVPAFNEEGMIGRVVREIERQAPDFNVLVVDDGSTDRTVVEAESEGATVLRHPFNLGIGGAMQSGYKYALAHGYDVAVQVDGDGQHKPEYLPEMLDALRTGGKEADMVYGTRFRGDPGYKVPLGRRLGNLIFSVVLSAITRQKITDPTSGFRMTNRRGIELFAPYAGQAAQVMLDSIEKGGTSRPDVIKSLFDVHVENGIVGSFKIDPSGDPSVGPITLSVARKSLKTVDELVPPDDVVSAARGPFGGGR